MKAHCSREKAEDRSACSLTIRCKRTLHFLDAKGNKNIVVADYIIKEKYKIMELFMNGTVAAQLSTIKSISMKQTLVKEAQ